jgi:predicted Zn finger-like uncharacterized protein
MILECPNCETSYEIPVELPPEGRKVRCVSCQHVWTATNLVPDAPEIKLSDFEDEEIVFKVEEGEPEALAVPEAETTTEAEADPAPEAEAVPEAEPEAVPAPAAEVEAVAETEDTGDEMDEDEIADAFATAFEEVPDAEPEPEPEAETGEAESEAEEEDSPPIVIGKAKKRRGPMLGNVAAGWAGLALVLTGVMAIAYFQRINVVSALPGAASTYERIGLPVNVRGLEFSEVKYSWETSAGRPVLEVFGNITNVTSEPLKVPTVVFGLRTKEKVEVYQWAADVRSELLQPGKQTKFSAQIPTPPKSIRDVQVRFAKVR